MEETEGPSHFYDSDTVRKFVLTEEAIAQKNEYLKGNDNEMTPQEKENLLRNTVRHWDLFYKRNNDHFFKDRAWLTKEMPEIASACRSAEENADENDKQCRPLLIDVGCGVGNALIPILRANPRLLAVAFDCSPRAIAMLRERWTATLLEQKQSQSSSDSTAACSTHDSCISIPSGLTCVPYLASTSQDESSSSKDAPPAAAAAAAAAAARKPTAAASAEAVASGEAQVYKYLTGQLRTVAAFDITTRNVPEDIVVKASGDFVLLVFVLSALHPRHHIPVAKRCAQLLKPGGVILFRDYARLDMAHLRFAGQRKPKVEQNLYARYDGTLAYYFLKEEVEDLFCKHAGLEMFESRYCMRELLNRKTQQRMERIWIQSKFRRPLSKKG